MIAPFAVDPFARPIAAPAAPPRGARCATDRRTDGRSLLLAAERRASTDREGRECKRGQAPRKMSGLHVRPPWLRGVVHTAAREVPRFHGVLSRCDVQKSPTTSPV